ncbi:MAG: hypothetical protein WD751_05080 [Anaerolineales bacterium]
MLLFLPAAILALTVLALVASNLQRGFRSSWLLALGGATLAFISLIYLRLQLPQTTSFAFFGFGEGPHFFLTFVLDEFSWPLALLIVSLFAGALLGEVRQAISAKWLSWAPGLVAAMACLLAVLSGDVLTTIFIWTLLDLVVYILLFTFITNAAERQTALQMLAVNLLASFLLLVAWTLSFYGQQLNQFVILAAVVLRLGILTPHLVLRAPQSLRADLSTMLLLTPAAAGIPLLARAGAMLEPAGSLLLILILLPAVFCAATWLFGPLQKSSAAYWDLGAGSLAAASAIGGQGSAALAFGMLMLAGRALLPLMQLTGRLRIPLAIIGSLFLSGLPYTFSHGAAGLFAELAWSTPFLLLAYSAILAGWLRRALGEEPLPLPAEPWMRTTQSLASSVIPIVLVLLGLGLLPSFSARQTFPLWPALVALIGAWSLFLFQRTVRFRIAPRPIQALEWILSLRWLTLGIEFAGRLLANLMAMLSSLLEGEAGILWAMLFMAFLLSLVGQFGLGG